MNTRKFLSKLMLVMLFVVLGKDIYAQHQIEEIRTQTAKYQRLLALMDAFYIDTVNLEQITEEAIVKALAELDPHSVYISKEEMADMNEPLEGGFFGIGIQFSIYQDSLLVVDVVAGGPSEKVGLKPSDRILMIDGENVAGVGLTNTGVRKRLKGEKGTVVELKVLRKGELIDFRIVRDKIPIHSINGSYMIDDKVGYINISRFGATTLDEFESALVELQAKGMQDLIIDLQSNGGGYMGAAVKIADHFLDANKLIVYTDGRDEQRHDDFSTPSGWFKKGRVAILIDRNSASASEILAGAMQDWDRGIVVGRRSFGKGLVQRQLPLTDGTMIRLTTAHYYTPSGRCIQKPYDKADEKYYTEVYSRYASGELLTADSIHVNDSLKYTTMIKKRTVYGGGGIIPDIFVPIDTSVNYLYYNMLIAKNVVGDYVTSFVEKHREEFLLKYDDFNDYVSDFNVTDDMLNEIVAEGEKLEIKKDEENYKSLVPEIKNQLKALIARDIWSMNEMYMIFNQDNEILQSALKALKDGEYEKVLN